MKVNHMKIRQIKTNKNLLKGRRLIKHSTILLWLLIGCSGCQLTQKPPIEDQYSHYYLWIKSLSSNELLNESIKQKQNISGGYYNAEVNLAMLYALPKSPLYNPYTAKTKLNQLTLQPNQAVQISSTNFGFITMMKDQLNQQILTLNKLLLTKQALQEHQATLKGKVTEHKTLMLKSLKLKQQIIQLKNIELDINEQEQKL